MNGKFIIDFLGCGFLDLMGIFDILGSRCSHSTTGHDTKGWKGGNYHGSLFVRVGTLPWSLSHKLAVEIPDGEEDRLFGCRCGNGPDAPICGFFLFICHQSD
jgi:hypothetical protein